jgi:hypothetical protein
MRVPLPAAITTTFIAMPVEMSVAMRPSLVQLVKTAIIAVALATLAGCSALRLAYNNGPLVTWWWLDGYVDFSGDQVPRAKAALDQLFTWARGNQLPEFAQLLTAAQGEVLLPTTPAQACRWQATVRERLEPALQHTLGLAAEQLPGLGEAQWAHLAGRFQKKNAEMRRDFLQPDLEERRERAVARVVERAEMLYGELGEAQLKVISAGVSASPFDPQAWLQERERRQRETLATLRRLQQEKAPRDVAVAGLRRLVDQMERSADPAYRSYQLRLNEYNCQFAAQVHNSTTPAQRQHARDKLQGWVEDLRALSAQRADPR